MQSKQKSKLPPGAGICPEAVTEQKAGYQTADALWTKVPTRFPVQEVRQYRTLKHLATVSSGIAATTPSSLTPNCIDSAGATQSAEAPDIA